MTLEHDTFLNKVWDHTLGKIPGKVIGAAVILPILVGIGISEFNIYWNKSADKKVVAKRVAEVVHKNNVTSKGNSLLDYGLTLVQEGKLDRADSVLVEAKLIGPGYVSCNNLERSIEQARNDRRLLPLRLDFANNQYIATKDAHTLWDIAPMYWEALYGKKPSSKDKESVYNLWMDMLKHRSSLKKDIDSINIGEKVELPEKWLADIMLRYD